jgi:hypothetical protein
MSALMWDQRGHAQKIRAAANAAGMTCSILAAAFDAVGPIAREWLR